MEDERHAKDCYYFADGERVRIEPDPDHVALQTESAELAKLPRGLQDKIKREGTELRRGFCLVSRTLLGNGLVDELEASGTAMPVYRDGRSLIVVLPEVRAEVSDDAQAKTVRLFLKSPSVEASSVKERGSRFSFRPSSHRGRDALDLANDLYEQVKPALAQARFIRITPRWEK